MFPNYKLISKFFKKEIFSFSSLGKNRYKEDNIIFNHVLNLTYSQYATILSVDLIIWSRLRNILKTFGLFKIFSTYT